MRFALRTLKIASGQMACWLWARKRMSFVVGAAAVLLCIAVPRTLPVLAQSQGTNNIFLPIVDQAGSAAATATPTPVATAASNDPASVVYGLLGELQGASGQSFGNFFVTQATKYYAIVGQTAAVEVQLNEVASRTPASPVKLWGVLVPGGAQVINAATGEASGTLDLIIVTSLLEAEATATSPGGSSDSGGDTGSDADETVTAVSKYNAVNLRAGPSLDYSPTNQIPLNEQCTVTGQTSDASWWFVRCADGATGWVDARFVTVTGSTDSVPFQDSPTVTPTPTATPLPTATPTALPTASPTAQFFSGWQTSFFGNTALQGNPVAVEDVSSVNFDWGKSAPYTNVPADNFSVRFQRQISLPAGNYRFTLRADDGVRFWFDNQLFIDEWHSSTNETYTASFSVLDGVHDLRIEYYEATGTASIFFSYQFLNTVGTWQADYYTNTSLSGNPVLSQSEARSTDPISYDWGYGSPQSSVIPVDNWSARWEGEFNFTGGNYRFRATGDDGVRLYLDDILVLDGWTDGAKELDNIFYGVGSGNHDVKIEYYERTGTARIRVWWYQDAGAQFAP